MNRDETIEEARATAPPPRGEPATATPPPDVRYALRLIMLAGSEGHGGSRGQSSVSLLGPRGKAG